MADAPSLADDSEEECGDAIIQASSPAAVTPQHHLQHLTCEHHPI